MLEYTKTILDKVSFDRFLFSKELRKSFKWLHRDEILSLYTWCMLMFGEIYGDLIKDAFKALS